MQVPAPDDNLKPPVLPRMTSSFTHDVTFSCLLLDVMAMGRGARPTRLEVTSSRTQTQSPASEDMELKLGAEGGAIRTSLRCR